MRKTFHTFGLPIFALTLLLLCFGLSNACKKSVDNSAAGTSSGPGTNEIWMQNTAYSPATITVAVNTTLKWTNKDGFTHTVTSTSGLFDSGTIDNGSAYSHQFTTAGTYTYKCTLHSNMNGTVIVK